MSGKIYFFNPENDMALANNTIYYKPPKEIIRMGIDLSVLPVWFADRGGVVKVTDRSTNEDFLHHYVQNGISYEIHLEEKFMNGEYVPWGWSPCMIHLLEQHGVALENIPTKEKMEQIRCLSGRQTCVEVLKCFMDLDYVCGKASACTSLEQVQLHVGSNGKSIIKSPWSGSGRGLMKVESTELDKNLLGWIARIIRTQGAVMVEPLYNKVVDFAMEFYAGDDEVRFCGYSMFETDDQGNYKCNILASDKDLEQKLTIFVEKKHLLELRKRLILVFNQLVRGKYKGYFGVDMMICADAERYKVHPCVEINMRMNMGVVSRIVFDRYISPDTTGNYYVEHFFSDGEAETFQRSMTANYPAEVHNARFLHGYFPLTPVQHTTRFHVYVLLD